MAKPVVLDTDIGFDVDDIWALAFMLKCPELDVKLITTSTGDTEYSEALVGKMLEIAGRTDIPIGIGMPIDAVGRTHNAWLGSYQVIDYPGEVQADGVGTIVDTITDDGMTLVDESGQNVRCSMNWRDLVAFEVMVAQRLAE